jgi:hypothetical protein
VDMLINTKRGQSSLKVARNLKHVQKGREMMKNDSKLNLREIGGGVSMGGLEKKLVNAPSEFDSDDDSEEDDEEDEV